VVRNCEFLDYELYGVYVSGAGADTVSAKDIDRNDTGEGQAGENITVENCTFSTNTNGTTALFLVGVTAGTGLDVYHKNVSIKNNNVPIHPSSNLAFQIRQSDGVVVQGNHISS